MLALDPRPDAVLLGLLDQLLAMRAFELDRHADVLRLGGQIGQPEAQGVGPELLDHVDRIDAVALRFRHPFAVAVENLGMDEHVVERNLADVVQARDHHPGDPERDDVAAGDEHAGGIIIGQFGRLLRPAEGRMRPEGRTEPGVQHVLLADELVARHGRFVEIFFLAQISHWPYCSSRCQTTSSRPANAFCRSAALAVLQYQIGI